jgi:hypothetical protein
MLFLYVFQTIPWLKYLRVKSVLIKVQKLAVDHFW